MATTETIERINQKFNVLKGNVEILRGANIMQKASRGEIALDSAVILLGELVQLINEGAENGK